MKLHLQEIKNYGPAPPIYYKPDSTANMNSEYKSDYLKVDINNQTVETGSEKFPSMSQFSSRGPKKRG